MKYRFWHHSRRKQILLGEAQRMCLWWHWKYTLPGPIGGHRLPAPQSSPPQSSTTGRQRLPRHCNFRPKRYLRNTLAGESFISSSSFSSSSSSTVNVISSKAFIVSSGLPKTATSGTGGRKRKEKKKEKKKHKLDIFQHSVKTDQMCNCQSQRVTLRNYAVP